MKTTATAIILALLAPLAVFAAVDPPGSIALIRPDPEVRVPQYANLTYGFTSSKTQYWGLIQNIRMSYAQPDGSRIESSTYGPSITSGGSFENSGYSPQECRSFPGTMTLNEVNATQTGQYTFFWDVTYVESSDSTKANSSYCGPPPFSQQTWTLNSTVTVADANLGPGIIAAIGSTTQDLPSKPTGRVNNGAVWMGGRAANWGSAVGLLLGVGLVA